MSVRDLRRIRRLERSLKNLIKREREMRLPTDSNGDVIIHPELRRLVAQESRRFVGTVCVLLWGNPKIDESVDLAWQRCKESKEWKSIRARHPHFGKNNRGEDMHPCSQTGVKHIGDQFFEYILPDLPGDDENEKLESFLAQAPHWLLWVTHADRRGEIIGLKIDLPDMKGYQRDEVAGRLGSLPEGPFHLHPLPVKRAYRGMTPRQLKRAVENVKRLREHRAAGGQSAELQDPPDFRSKLIAFNDQVEREKQRLQRKYGP